jgi:hypothetical protein
MSDINRSFGTKRDGHARMTIPAILQGDGIEIVGSVEEGAAGV